MVGHTAARVQVAHVAVMALRVGRRIAVVVAPEEKDMAEQGMRGVSAMMQENLKHISGPAQIS